MCCLRATSSLLRHQTSARAPARYGAPNPLKNRGTVVAPSCAKNLRVWTRKGSERGQPERQKTSFGCVRLFSGGCDPFDTTEKTHIGLKQLRRNERPAAPQVHAATRPFAPTQASAAPALETRAGNPRWKPRASRKRLSVQKIARQKSAPQKSRLILALTVHPLEPALRRKGRRVTNELPLQLSGAQSFALRLEATQRRGTTSLIELTFINKKSYH